MLSPNASARRLGAILAMIPGMETTQTDTADESAIRAKMRVHSVMRDYSDAVLAKCVTPSGYAVVFGPGEECIADKVWLRIFREEFVKACVVHLATPHGKRRAGDPLSGR